MTRATGTLGALKPVHQYSEPGLPWSVGLTWTRSPDLRPDSEALRRETLVRSLAGSIFNRRLQRIAAEPGSPFVNASLSSQSAIADAVGTTAIGAVTAPGAWRPALGRMEQEVRRLRQYGVTRAELDRELAEYRASYQALAAGANTRNTRGLAEALVSAATEPQVFTHPRDQFARFEAVAKTLTPEAVNATLPGLFSGNGPSVSLVSPTAVPDAEREVLAALGESQKVAVAAPAAGTVKRWPYGNWGRSGAVASRASLGEGLDVTDVRFANGVRLLVKPTKFDDDAVLVTLGFGEGAAALPRDVDRVAHTSLGPAMSGGGLGAYSVEELKEVLSDRAWGVSFGAGEDRYSLTGSTRPADLRVQLEVLAAKLTDPGWRPAATDQMRAVADTIHESLETQPGSVLARESAKLLTPDDPRDDVPEREVLKVVSPEAARGLLAPALAGAPLTLVVVGDVAVDTVVAEAARTFGALPPRRARLASTHAPQFLRTGTAQPIRRTHRGGAEQAAAMIRWPTADFHADPRAARAREFLAEIMQLRLTDEFREKQGTTYGTSAGASSSTRWAGIGTISASIQAPPDKVDDFVTGTKRIARELAASGPTPDELQRVREPALASLRRSRTSSNAYWLGQIADMADDPRAIAAFRSRQRDIETITTAEVQAEARRWLTDESAWSLVVVPEPEGAAGAN